MLYNLVDNLSDDFKLSLDFVHELCETIDTPRSLTVSLLLQYQLWEEYLDLSIDFGQYEDPRHLALDYLVTEILRKNPDIPLGIDRTKVALDSFKESEARCYCTNERLRGPLPEWHLAFRRKLNSILGPLRNQDLKRLGSLFRHGPGATTGVAGIGSSLSDKYDKPFHLTTGLLPFFRSIIGEQWWEHHRRSKHEIVEGNKFTTVPKSAKTDRGICVEPTLNMYVQLGVGTLLRNRLRRFGINLNSQDRNRTLARRAYDESLVTIDLSQASDSLSRNLVLDFFPQDWFELLHLSRSDFCNLGDEIVELEKWSSMGNGYTFELETLVFYAVCATFVPFDEMDSVSVYGDDIIVPSAYAAPVIDALNFLGFEVNHQKSYLAGNFFESCGHDYFKGVNVRPFYLKGSKEKIPYSLQIVNKLRKYSSQLNYGESCDNTFEPLWRRWVRRVPRIYRRCKVPESFGDVGLIVSFEEARVRRASHGIEGYVVRQIAPQSVERVKNTKGVLLSSLARLERAPIHAMSNFLLRRLLDARVELPSDLFSKGREPIRGYLRLARTRSSVVHRWASGLSWASPVRISTPYWIISRGEVSRW